MLQVQPGTQIGQHCLPERRVIDATHPALFDDGPTRDNGTLNMQSIRPDQHAAQYRYTGKHPVFHQMTGSDQRQFRRTAQMQCANIKRGRSRPIASSYHTISPGQMRRQLHRKRQYLKSNRGNTARIRVAYRNHQMVSH